MWKFARPMIAAGLFLTGAALTPSGPALAGSCAADAVCVFELTNANVSNIGPIDIRVTWDNTGATTTLSVQWISGGPGTPGFINEFGYNSAVTVSSISYNGNNVTGSWTIGGSSNIDGFGTFASDIGNGPTAAGSREGILFPIVFTLASEITNIPDTGNGSEFVAHVGGYSSGCSAFVSDGTSSSSSTNASCAAVPEPTTLLLVGTGLAALGIFGRKRFAKGPITA